MDTLTDKAQPQDAASLCREMAKVRQELRSDVDEVVENAKELTDWRYYFRQYPFACVGAAMAVGFLAVPQKLAVMHPTARQLEKLARRQHLVVEPQSAANAAPTSWTGQLLNFGSNLALRAALAYVGQQAGKLLGNEAAESTEAKHPQRQAK